MGLKVIGQHDDRTVQQLERCVAAEAGAMGVLCADGHLGYSMPIGGVVGYRKYVSPSGVGYDIACGNLAVQTDIMARDLPLSEYERLADEIQKRVSFGVGRANDEPVDDAVFEDIARSPVPQQVALLRTAMDQLGTVGSGNHYVDVLEDEAGVLWVAVHFGSRGFGHKTAKGFMNVAQGRAFDDGHGEGEMDAPPLLLDVSQPSGQDYIAAMQVAGKYAYAGRVAVVEKVLAIMGARQVFAVHNHHNFAWYEQHNFENREWYSETLWVVRKGATPAFPDQWGFVGGSMGDISVVIKGVNSDTSRSLMYSTVHGAGRVMSRTQAAGKGRRVSRWKCQDHRRCDYSAPKGGYHKVDGGETPKCPQCGHKLRLTPMVERIKAGLVDFDAEKQALSARGIVLRGAGADEAPPVYRPLQSVLDAHAETIQVMHVLQPRIVVMAGGEVYDPYKD